MAGRTWIKQGVTGDLVGEARKGFGRLARSYHARGLDFFCTSLRESTHSPGSLHYDGKAWDYEAQGVPLEDDRKVLGEGFDVVDEADHRHAEWDPHR